MSIQNAISCNSSLKLESLFADGISLYQGELIVEQVNAVEFISFLSTRLYRNISFASNVHLGQWISIFLRKNQNSASHLVNEAVVQLSLRFPDLITPLIHSLQLPDPFLIEALSAWTASPLSAPNLSSSTLKWNLMSLILRLQERLFSNAFVKSHAKLDDLNSNVADSEIFAEEQIRLICVWIKSVASFIQNILTLQDSSDHYDDNYYNYSSSIQDDINIYSILIQSRTFEVVVEYFEFALHSKIEATGDHAGDKLGPMKAESDGKESSGMEMLVLEAVSLLEIILAEFIFRLKEAKSAMDCTLFLRGLKFTVNPSISLLFSHPIFCCEGEVAFCQRVFPTNPLLKSITIEQLSLTKDGTDAHLLNVPHYSIIENSKDFSLLLNELQNERVLSILAHFNGKMCLYPLAFSMSQLSKDLQFVYQLLITWLLSEKSSLEDDLESWSTALHHLVQIGIADDGQALALRSLTLVKLFLSKARSRPQLIRAIESLLQMRSVNQIMSSAILQLIDYLLKFSFHFRSLILPILAARLDFDPQLMPLLSEHLPVLLHSASSDELGRLSFCLATFHMGSCETRQSFLLTALAQCRSAMSDVRIFGKWTADHHQKGVSGQIALILDTLKCLIEKRVVSPQLIWEHLSSMALCTFEDLELIVHEKLCAICALFSIELATVDQAPQHQHQNHHQLQQLNDGGKEVISFELSPLLCRVFAYLKSSPNEIAAFEAFTHFNQAVLQSAKGSLPEMLHSILSSHSLDLDSRMSHLLSAGIFALVKAEVKGMARSVFLNTINLLKKRFDGHKTLKMNYSDKLKGLISDAPASAKASAVYLAILVKSQYSTDPGNFLKNGDAATSTLSSMPPPSQVPWRQRLFVMDTISDLICQAHEAIVDDPEYESIVNSRLVSLESKMKSLAVASSSPNTVASSAYNLLQWSLLSKFCGGKAALRAFQSLSTCSSHSGGPLPMSPLLMETEDVKIVQLYTLNILSFSVAVEHHPADLAEIMVNLYALPGALFWMGKRFVVAGGGGIGGGVPVRVENALEQFMNSFQKPTLTKDGMAAESQSKADLLKRWNELKGNSSSTSIDASLPAGSLQYTLGWGAAHLDCGDWIESLVVSVVQPGAASRRIDACTSLVGFVDGFGRLTSDQLAKISGATVSDARLYCWIRMLCFICSSIQGQSDDPVAVEREESFKDRFGSESILAVVLDFMKQGMHCDLLAMALSKETVNFLPSIPWSSVLNRHVQSVKSGKIAQKVVLKECSKQVLSHPLQKLLTMTCTVRVGETVRVEDTLSFCMDLIDAGLMTISPLIPIAIIPSMAVKKRLFSCQLRHGHLLYCIENNLNTEIFKSEPIKSELADCLAQLLQMARQSNEFAVWKALSMVAEVEDLLPTVQFIKNCTSLVHLLLIPVDHLKMLLIAKFLSVAQTIELVRNLLRLILRRREDLQFGRGGRVIGNFHDTAVVELAVANGESDKGHDENSLCEILLIFFEFSIDQVEPGASSVLQRLDMILLFWRHIKKADPSLAGLMSLVQDGLPMDHPLMSL